MVQVAEVQDRAKELLQQVQSGQVRSLAGLLTQVQCAAGRWQERSHAPARSSAAMQPLCSSVLLMWAHRSVTNSDARPVAQELAPAEAAALKKRKLVVLKTWKTYHITRGSKFARERRKLAHDLTFEMLQK